MNSTVFGESNYYSFTGFITVIAISMIHKKFWKFFMGAYRCLRMLKDWQLYEKELVRSKF